jgi:hypothetical protein
MAEAVHARCTQYLQAGQCPPLDDRACQTVQAAVEQLEAEAWHVLVLATKTLGFAIVDH